MVGVTIDCRFGNQLFQFAFIKALAKRFKTSFYISEQVEQFMLPQYFHLEGYSTLLNRINWLRLKIEAGTLASLQSKQVGTYNENEADALTDKAIYTGYFQSAHFFENIKDEIGSIIRLKSKYVKQFQTQYQKIFAENKVIAIHVRRGDYLNLNSWWAQNFGSNDLTLPVAYYLDALKQVEDLESYKLIFLSDDIAFVRSAFGHLKNAAFAENPLIIDFQLLMNADVCVLSNSSFSWWAAYLNQKKNKKVYCPENWLGFKIGKEYPDEIIPAEWIKISAANTDLLGREVNH